MESKSVGKAGSGTIVLIAGILLGAALYRTMFIYLQITKDLVTDSKTFERFLKAQCSVELVRVSCVSDS